MVTAVITGASSGLGKEYINAIINQYPSVDAFWLVARRKELLKEIAQEHPDKTIAAISLDLGEEESLEIFEKLLKGERAGDQGAGEQRGLWQVHRLSSPPTGNPRPAWWT